MRISVRNISMALTSFTLALTAAISPAAAQQPRIAHAQLESRSAAVGLSPAFHALAVGHQVPVWIAYAVPVISGGHRMCCYEYSGHRTTSSGCCRLEEKSAGTDVRSPDEKAGEKQEERTVSLEGSPFFLIFFRVAGGKVQEIRTFSRECQIDAGGRTVYWLTDVRVEESVEMLSAFVRAEHWPEMRKRSDEDEDDGDDDDSESTGHAAIAAIAFHAGPAADAALESFVAPAQPESLRRQAAFWLGVERGRRGFEVLRRMVHDDPSDGVRGHAIFALSQSKVPEAIDAMIDTARHDRSGHVRGQALFWLAQCAGRKAESAITAAIESDPETDVKKKAVFALSQLPPSQGVPLLISVARSNRNPAVRKQAIFWLGQSEDPRALSYFEEVLK